MKSENICEFNLDNVDLKHLCAPFLKYGFSFQSMTVFKTAKKDLLGLESPFKALEVQIQPSNRYLKQISFLEALIGSSAWCRLLIFWSVITTLASVVSIYCAIGKS